MEQFEQLLTCAICLDRYRNPKLLPCQHSFCMEPCMDGLVDYVRRQVKCPECRAEHRIPYQGVQAFPTNVTLQRFLELHIEITGELPDPTSGQTMERCGVCSEKSYCALCVHCEKKCCPECKDAHMDILRREITRINSQVRRGLHRLQDALALVEKNTLGLQTNSASVAEEVDEIYRRLSKALKDRTEQLRNELDRYLGTELRGLIQLKENLELEIANIQSNCDLAEAHINENVPWDDAELLDTKELFLRTVEFIRNFEYEAGDYGRRVRFVMAHDPNQLVLHVAGYGELNIKPETGSSGLLGSSSGTLAPPGGSPGLMRSKSDHRLASQYRQPDDDRLTRNRYVPDYEYDTPEYEAPRNKSRYRSRFMRHRDGEDSDGDTRTTVRFTGTQDTGNARERVLDTEDAARGPLSGIFRLTDSPRVMKKLQEYERAGKRKKEEPVQPPPAPQPKPQVQVRKAPTSVARQVSEDDEISRIKKQNKNVPTPPETVEERQPPSVPVHQTVRETQEREPEELPRRTPISRRTSTDTHAQGTRSASSDSSTGSESSSGSGIRNTGAPFTAEEMKQKYLSRAPPTNTTTTVSSGPGSLSSSSHRDPPTTTTSSTRPFQSRFLGAGNRAAPPPPQVAPTPAREEPKKKEEDEEDEDETSSSSEETETETEEESETETRTTTTAPSTTQDRQRNESAMARTDIGPLLARSAEARRGSKEDSPSSRYVSPRGSPAQTTTPTTTTSMTTPSGYTSRFVKNDYDIHDLGSNSNNFLDDNDNNRLRVVNDDEFSPNKIINENSNNNRVAILTNLSKSIIMSDGNSMKHDDITLELTKINDFQTNQINNITNENSPPHNEENNSQTNNNNNQIRDEKNNLIINDTINKTIIDDENIIWNNDQNVFLSSRESGLDGNQSKSSSWNNNVKNHGNYLANNNIKDKQNNDSHSNKFSNDNNSLVNDLNNHGTNNETIITDREIFNPIIETRNDTDNEDNDDDKNLSDESEIIHKNTNDIENLDSEFEDIKEEDKNNKDNIKVNESNENIKTIKNLEKTEEKIINGIPKIVINQFSSENEQESEEESSEIEDSDQKLQNDGQIVENTEIQFDDNGWIVNDDLPNQLTNSSHSIMENFSNENINTNETSVKSRYLSADEEIDERNDNESNNNSEKKNSRIYRQGSIGKNGWMTSEDESESETEAPNSSTLPLDDNDEENNNNDEMDDDNEKRSEEEKTILNQMDKEKMNQMANDNEMNHYSRMSDNKKEDHTTERDVSVPMQMVTTVLCVSVLCCSVLINLFL